MIRKSKFASFEPSGQLKLFGTFQAILPIPTHCNGCTTWSSRCHTEILGVTDPDAPVGPQECSSARRAALGAFQSAGQPSRCTLQHEKRCDHKRFLSPSPNTACAEGQHLNLEFMPQAPARPGTPSFPPVDPGWSSGSRGPSRSDRRSVRSAAAACFVWRQPAPRLPFHSVLSPALALPVPPFSSSSYPSQLCHPLYEPRAAFAAEAAGEGREAAAF